MCMQKSRERGRYLVFFDELSSLLTVKNANRHDNGCLPPGELHLNHGADKSSLQEGAGRQSADGGPFNHDTGKRLGEGQAGRVPRRPVPHTVTRYLPKNPAGPLSMRRSGRQAGRGAPNQIGTST
jgi:hypothetical protein